MHVLRSQVLDMLQNNELKLLLGNEAGYNALVKHIDSEIARIDDSISRAARAVLFEPDKRDHAIQLVGQKTALTDLLNTLKSLETTTREGK